MDELSKEYVLSFFNQTLALHGNRPEALRWTMKGQLRHYETIVHVAKDISGTRILDFGCGKGDFYGYLMNRGIMVDYTGIDINQNLISLAKMNHPEARFMCIDILQEDLNEVFDYIFICGVFNLKFQGIEDTIKEVLRKVFRICTTAVAFNALSAHTPKKEFVLNYIYPEDILRFAITELTPFVALRHDTMSYDFNLFLYKELNP
ncbi:MAG: class I SAM-dependent methyltransferase [Thermodesulfovibrionales bacterium]|nr:class I SAM-dependent methyltransferase [Thermodesulfovibrionales bacterium]